MLWGIQGDVFGLILLLNVVCAFNLIELVTLSCLNDRHASMKILALQIAVVKWRNVDKKIEFQYKVSSWRGVV